MKKTDTGPRPSRKVGRKSINKLELPEAWKPKKLPKTLGECVDRLYMAREARLRAQHIVDAQQEEETRLRDHLAEQFKWNEIEGARGGIAQASVSRVEHATLKDPLVFFKWVAKTKSFDLLHRRVSDEAARARWEKKINIPGVEKFIEHKLSLTKIPNKK